MCYVHFIGLESVLCSLYRIGGCVMFTLYDWRVCYVHFIGLESALCSLYRIGECALFTL